MFRDRSQAARRNTMWYKAEPNPNVKPVSIASEGVSILPIYLSAVMRTASDRTRTDAIRPPPIESRSGYT